MYILTQPYRDPMLIDSIAGLETVHAELMRFLRSQSVRLEVPGGASFPLDGNIKVLSGLRAIKHDSQLSLSVSSDNWLEIVAPLPEIRVLAQKLIGLKDGEHVHWYCSPASLIIQAEQDLQDGMLDSRIEDKD